MPQKSKKSKREKSLTTKQISSSRVDQTNSALQRTRHNKKARKSIRIISSMDQQDQPTASFQQPATLPNQRASRAHTFSPDKQQHIYKLDPYHMPKIPQDSAQAAAQPRLQTFVPSSDMKTKQNNQQDSKLYKSKPQYQNERPITGGGQTPQPEYLKQESISQEQPSQISNNHPSSTLNNYNKVNIAFSIKNKTNQNSIGNINSPEYQKGLVTHSPIKNGQPILPNQQNLNGLISQATMQAEYQQEQVNVQLMQKFQNPKQIIVQQQQQMNPQFSHIIGFQGQNTINGLVKQKEDILYSQPPGLLNMSKQRGMMNYNNNQQIFVRNALIPNVRPNQQNFNQIQQQQKQYVLIASSLQNNGKQILSKSPMFNVASNIKQNPVNSLIVPNTQAVFNKDIITTVKQQPYSLDVSECISNSAKIPQPQRGSFTYQLTQNINTQQHHSHSLANSRQPQKQLLAPIQSNNINLTMNQQFLQQQKKSNSSSYQYGIYFYESPVQVNGKQMNLPLQPQLNQQQKLECLIKRNGSERAIQLSKYDSNLISIFEQSTHANNDEYLKQCILQELLDNQQDPTQILLNEKQKTSTCDITTPIQTTKAKNEQIAKSRSKIPFANAYVEDCYKFIVTPGNNSVLIKRAMERRDWWIEIPQVHSMFNFKWQPVSFGIKFERLSPLKPKIGEIGAVGSSQFSNAFGANPGMSTTYLNSNNIQAENVQLKQMVNHFEGHHHISEKANLFNSLQKYCDLSKENIFDLVPITFYVEIHDLDKTNHYNQAVQPFTQFYQVLEENRNRIQEIEEFIENHKQKQQQAEAEVQQEEQQEGEKVTQPKDILSLVNKAKPEQNLQNTKGTKFRTFNFEKRSSTKYTLPFCHFQGYNLWLLKPTHLNRGRGIHVFRDLETMHKLIKEYCHGKDEEMKVKKEKQDKEKDGGSLSPEKDQNQMNKKLSGELQQVEENYFPPESPTIVTKAKSSQQAKKQPQGYKIKHNTFIIQKYIEKPLLICNRKFDIRVWVLLTQELDLYIFKEGYLRTSSSEFSIDLENVDNQYVHLTNNAVQKFSDTYGEFEDGNQLNYDRFQELLDKQDPDSGYKVREHFIPQMHEQIIKSMYSVRKRMDPFKRKHCFELFGYDFILDSDYNTWLIEVNTNPCIEESSQLLKMYIPRMIEDMLRLTVDVIFPKSKTKKRKNQSTFNNTVNSPLKQRVKQSSGNNNSIGKIEENDKEQTGTFQQSIIQEVEAENNPENEEKLKKEPKSNSRIHPVTGYSDTENMWEKVWNLEKHEMPPNKFPNCRSEFNIHVNEQRQFKLKKNPLFKDIQKQLFGPITEIKENVTMDSPNEGKISTE